MKDNWQEYRILHLAALGQAIKPAPLGRIWRRVDRQSPATAVADNGGGFSAILAPHLTFFIRMAICGGVPAMLGFFGLPEAASVGIPPLDAFVQTLINSLTRIGAIVGSIGFVLYIVALIDW